MRDAVKRILRNLRLLRLLRFSRGAFCRFLDILAGAFCFIFVRPPHLGIPRRILAIRLDRIGDLVLTTPALRALKETYPQARLVVLARRYTKDIIGGLPFVDDVIAKDDFSKKQLVERLREEHFDAALAFHPDAGANRLMWMARIPRRIGFKICGSGVFLTHAVFDDRHRRIRHEVETALEIAGNIGAKTDDRTPAVATSEEGELFAEQFFKKHGLAAGDRFVIIHPGARQPYVRWRKQGFAEVADRLIREKKARVLLVGSEEERTLVYAVVELMRERPIVAVGLNLTRLISVVKRARLFVGNSTGPMHLAAALRVPVVAIFGATHPRDSFKEWGPWGKGHIVVSRDPGCRHCHPGDCLTFECMKAVAAEDVFAAVSKLLGEG